MDPELERIAGNIRLLIDAGKDEATVLNYLREEGYSSLTQWRASLSAGRVVPAGSPLAGGARAPADRVTAASNAPSRDPLTVRDVLRLGAAGVVPGWSDEIAGRLRSLSPSMTYDEAVAAERAGLASARSKAGSTFLELGAGLLAGGGLASAAARGTGTLARGAQAVTGIGRAAPATVAGALGRGARTGAALGALAGSGAADDGDLRDRVTGGLVGAGAGAVLGAGAEGGLFGVMRRLARPQLDATDLRTAFGADTPEARRAVTETAETMRRGDRRADDALAQLAGGDLAPDYPLVPADLGGGATRTQLARVDLAAQRGGATDVSENIAEQLLTRQEGTAARQSENITRATGRRTGAASARAEELAAQRRAVGDLMYDRFRAEARKASSWTMRTTPELEAAFQDKVMQDVTKAVSTSMRRGSRSGRLGANDGFVSPYVPRVKAPGTGTPFKKPTPVTVQKSLDPITLSEVSRELGERAHKARLAGDNTLSSDLTRFKKLVDGQLETIPEFAEANAVMARFHDYAEALEAGSKIRPRAGVADVAHELEPYRTQTPLPLPADVADEVARIAQLPAGTRALPGSWDEVTRGAQIQRRAATEARESLLPDNLATRELDEMIFGPGPTAMMREGTRLEREMAATAGASPSARGQINPLSPESGQERAAFGSLVRDLMYGVNSPRLGIALSMGDLARLGAYKTMRPTNAQLAAEARGLLSTGDARDAFLRLVGQTQRGFDTPVRRGLLDAAGYAAGGWPDR